MQLPGAGLAVGTCALVSHIFTYFYKVRDNELHYQSNPLNERILSESKVLTTRFYPSFLLPASGHLHTILGTICRTPPKIKYQREVVPTPDGGEVTLDFVENSNLKPDTPTVVFLHGLAGSSSSYYMRCLVDHAHRTLNWRLAVFNVRGTGDTTLKSPRMFSAAWTEDIRLVANHVKEKYPDSPLAAVGVSLGGNILIKYLGEEANKTPFKAAVSICNPFDLILGDKLLTQSAINSFVYGRHLASGLKKYARRNQDQLCKIEGANVQQALRVQSIHEFDKALVVPAFKFQNNFDYYSHASSSKYVDTVSIPLLAINAADDPLSIVNGVPLQSVHKNPNLMFLITSCGGHLGYMEGFPSWKTSWSDRAAIDFLRAVIPLTSSTSKPTT